MKRRRWTLAHNGPGRYRLKLAAMLAEQLGIEVEAHDIHQNSSPSDRQLDMCRWCAWGLDQEGRRVQVHSWDKMGDIVKAGRVVVVSKDFAQHEVCAG